MKRDQIEKRAIRKATGLKNGRAFSLRDRKPYWSDWYFYGDLYRVTDSGKVTKFDYKFQAWKNISISIPKIFAQ